tara:strand:+ start:809 stop:1207 length:399 start_codon:yes stop_codon:yes gene_type:complete
MAIKFINPKNSPPPAANYTNLAVVPQNHRLLVLAGQIGNLMDGTLVDGLEAQYKQALKNILSIVESEGGTAGDIARITIFLTEKPGDHSLIKAANDDVFNGQNPAMSWLYVAGLFRPDVKVEIEAIASVSVD